jgi:hypothetical protein
MLFLSQEDQARSIYGTCLGVCLSVDQSYSLYLLGKAIQICDTSLNPSASLSWLSKVKLKVQEPEGSTNCNTPV